MNVALIASNSLSHPGDMERHVIELACGLARRGTEIEVLTQAAGRRVPPCVERDGVVFRRFATVVGTTRFAVAPGLWDHLRLRAASFDLVDVHTDHVPLGLAAARAGFRRLVFTPHAPVQHLLRWSHSFVTRALVDAAVLIVCDSRVDRDLLSSRYPWAANRIRVGPTGVDVTAIRAARPFAYPVRTWLAIGRLERQRRVHRAIATMPSLGPAGRLVVVGDGPYRQRLHAHAADLRVSSRVQFVGSISSAERYRWLRTGHVLLALAEQHDSGLHVTEALAAGVPVVASDIPIHREVASELDSSLVLFVSPEGSPLEVADAISEAGSLRSASTAHSLIPSLATEVDATLERYEALVFGHPRATATNGTRNGRAKAPALIHERTDDLTGSPDHLTAHDLSPHG